MNLDYEESQSLYLMTLGSSVGTPELVLNFNLVLKYNENDLLCVLLFECQEYYVMAVLHRKMIPRGHLLLMQSVDIFKFDYENATSSLNSICMLLAIAVCVNRESVVVIKRMLKWRDLPPKHGANRFLELVRAMKLGCNFEFVSVVVLDRISKPTDAHVRGRMLRLVNGVTCTKVTNGEHFHNAFVVLISLLKDPCWVKLEIARIIVSFYNPATFCDYVQTESMYSQDLAKRLNAFNLDLVAIDNFLEDDKYSSTRK